MNATAADRRRNLSNPGSIATIVVVVLAYVVTLIGFATGLNTPDGPLYSATRLAAAVALGIPFLYLALADPAILQPIAGRHAQTLFFVLLILLALLIQILVAGSTGIWLINMPIIAMAVTDLRGPWRWLIPVLSLFVMALPIALVSSWQNAILPALTYLPAVVFVIVFVRLTQIAELAQRDAERLAAQLEEANHRLAAYAVQAEELATTQERNRLAREIHDNLGHYLTVVNVQIKAAEAMLERNPDRARESLGKAQRLTEEGLAAVRQSVSSLRDSPLGARSLAAALGDLAEETRAGGLVVALQTRGTPRPLEPRVELTLYRAAQEGLTNVSKHADASRVDLTLDYSDAAAVCLCVEDNGVGPAAAADASPGFGLLGLAERAAQLAGRLESGPRPGARGFRLAITLPTAAANVGPPTTGDSR